jgi:hypothetical protein
VRDSSSRISKIFSKLGVRQGPYYVHLKAKDIDIEHSLNLPPNWQEAIVNALMNPQLAAFRNISAFPDLIDEGLNPRPAWCLRVEGKVVQGQLPFIYEKYQNEILEIIRRKWKVPRIMQLFNRLSGYNLCNRSIITARDPRYGAILNGLNADDERLPLGEETRFPGHFDSNHLAAVLLAQAPTKKGEGGFELEDEKGRKAVIYMEPGDLLIFDGNKNRHQVFGVTDGLRASLAMNLYRKGISFKAFGHTFVIREPEENKRDPNRDKARDKGYQEGLAKFQPARL